MDALEDSSEDLLWQWELRDVKAIPKALKPAARAHKKLMQKVWYPHLSCKSLYCIRVCVVTLTSTLHLPSL